MRKKVLSCVLLSLLSIPLGATAPDPAKGERLARQVIRTEQDMPRRMVTLTALPSQLLQSPRAAWQPAVDVLERDLRSDLRRLDIQDRATLRHHHEQLLNLALWREDWAAVPVLVDAIKALQDKPGPKAVAGLLASVVAEQNMAQHPAPWVGEQIRLRLSAYPWADIAAQVQAMRAEWADITPNNLLGVAQQRLDEQAQKAHRRVPQALLAQLVDMRVQLHWFYPLREQIEGSLTALLREHEAQQAHKPDIWSPRQFELAAHSPASEVGIGIWDSGVDVSLFNTTAVPGVVLDHGTAQVRFVNPAAQPPQGLLTPLGEASERWPEMQRMFTGAVDLRMGQADSANARAYQARMASIAPSQVKAFQDDLELASLYVHGTHVATIVSAGNPFARIFSATMLMKPQPQAYQHSTARSQRIARAYHTLVQTRRQQGVRVVNMSWRYGPADLEAGLGEEVDAAQRAIKAQALFAIERDGLHQAIASAPDILFVAGAGNEDNSANFQAYIPASLELPNLITVGAVDAAGAPTHFTSAGQSVRVYANGHQISGLIPGGQTIQLSGTSMASPQVANLAAKLFALRPQLTVAQVLQAIEQTATTEGTVRVIHPRAAAEHLGLRLATAPAAPGR